ncbi:2,3-dihydroxybenzoate-AMP ligase [Kineosphaera limosa]|uniref:L-lysine N6-monooxygenase MbtG n=1 Tax=Kineosphaera limosa NBRC 100340 TaxID=1184609 RepID=K6VFG3_9MICO|nr:SidA/IucD/PvdA family monooxygenase [Kineosphaera limosa]NYE00877.1 2,3-dihydroxybenzoate-AMP ligase [Kineosphaera limosa]GAB94928.1 putative 2,3-dihydroxybenzoate-AMP ligase [Kineosphaera limosa NBRC 100340]
MTSLQHSAGVTPYPPSDVQRYLQAGLWGKTRIEDLIARRAARRPDAPAVVDAAGTTTYRQLVAAGERAAGVLAAGGVTAGDAVFLHMPNTVDAIAALLGAFRLGALPIAALSTHRGAEIAGFLAAGRATHWVLGDLLGVDPDTLVRDVTARVGHDVAVIRWTGRPMDRIEAPPPARDWADAEELAFFQLSGGTTGASKLIPRAHREYAYSFLRSNELCGVDESTVLVIPLPLTHNFPMSSPGFLGVLSAGGCVVLCAHGDPATICAAIQTNRATHLIGVPPLIQVLLDSAARRGADLRTLRRVLVGGARLSPAVARRIHGELGCLQQVYGMAEGLVCYTSPTDDLDTIVTTQGRPMSAFDEVRVVAVDDAGAGLVGTPVDVGAGEVGELQVRGPYTIRGYYFGGPREHASFTPDGFYRTGDLVRRDETGSITVVGRTKEQINRGGEKVAPAEVEDALLRHPGVHDACVVAEADELLGERVVAYVVPRATAPSSSEANGSSGGHSAAPPAPIDRRELRRHLVAQSLAAYKIPDAYRIVEALPTTAVGKVARRRVTPPVATIAASAAPAAAAPRSGPEVLDVLGVGFGPANMALAVAIREENERRATGLAARFVDAAPYPRWHEGLLFEDASMQVAFAKDLATMRNPRSAFTFVQFLAERGRLADFVNRGSMTPLRVEFVEYLRWAAEKLRDDVTYAARVEAVTPVVVDGAIEAYDVDISDAAGMTRLRSRHVVLAVGLQPIMPAQLPAGPRVWHASQHLHRVGDLDPATTRDVVVLGGGQSAAEVVLHLREQLPSARIHAVHGKFAYTPSDSSPFANRIFDPASVDVLFDAPEPERARVNALHANTNDAVVSPATLQTLFDLDYRDRWLGRERVIWHPCTRVLEGRDRGDAVELDLIELLGGSLGAGEMLARGDSTGAGRVRLRADAVVCATGYVPLDPAALLGDSGRALRRDASGRPLARRDYAAEWDVNARGQLFLIGQTRHQHGVSATLLSNVAVRAGEIVATVTQAGRAANASTAGPGRVDRPDQSRGSSRPTTVALP